MPFSKPRLRILLIWVRCQAALERGGRSPRELKLRAMASFTGLSPPARSVFQQRDKSLVPCEELRFLYGKIEEVISDLLLRCFLIETDDGRAPGLGRIGHVLQAPGSRAEPATT